MPHFEVELDRAAGKGVGAGGAFQVVSIADASRADRTSLIEPGKQYVRLNELLADIAHALGRDLEDVTVEEI